MGEGGSLGKGWGGHSHSRGRVGLGTQGCGLALPGTVHSRLGPPPSRLVSPWAGSDTLTQKLTEGQKDPFDCSQTWDRWYPWEGSKKMATWVWWGEEPAASLRSRSLRERAEDSQEVWQEDMPEGLHGWVEQKQPLERRFFSSAKITAAGPKWEVSRAGRLT